jgi:hypothetical protein
MNFLSQITNRGDLIMLMNFLSWKNCRARFIVATANLLAKRDHTTHVQPPQGPLDRVRGTALWAGADTIKRSLRSGSMFHLKS